MITISTYPKIYVTLEFDKIIQHIETLTQTKAGQKKVHQLKPSDDLNTLITWQQETDQSLKLLQRSHSIPIVTLGQLDESFKRLELGAGLNGKELNGIKQLLTSSRDTVRFFKQQQEEDKWYPQLSYWVDQIVNVPHIMSALTAALEDDGSVKTSASSQLSSIRRQQDLAEQQARKTLNDLIKHQSEQLSDKLITIRNQRYVLPVKATYRASFKGTVHDQSASGQTLFIEPQAVVQLNNKLAELSIQERREIERILFELSQQLMPHIDEIKLNQELIAQLDFIQARARYAKEIDGTRPYFNVSNQIALWQAHHPLIDRKQSVANDILIGEHYRSLIITGPNTGGKTILLKTLGLLQLMGQSGLHIPANEHSQLGVFDGIYADIGDEQSIEQSLSTFSSHMTNIVDMINSFTHRSLLLFDELGSGTDPQEGAALAMGILEYIRKVGATVMATTHYPELKVYAHEAPNTVNASMEFDQDTLSPTYRLLIGVPGRSNALQISERLGLRTDILNMARQEITVESQSMNEMVANLEHQRRRAEEKERRVQTQLAKADSLLKDLKREFNRYQNSKEQLMEKARKQANQVVDEAQEDAERIIQEIRDLQLEQGEHKTIKEHILIDKRTALNQLKQAETLKKNRVLQRAKKKKELKVGDDVEVLTYGQRGTIIEADAKNNEYIVQMGILKLTIKEKDLKPLKETASKPQVKVNVQRNVGPKAPTSLDLRGERYEQAMARLDQYIDAALLSHHPQVTIIHGKGTGALRQGVHQYLKRHPQVDSFAYSHPNAGGDGSTIVVFK